MAGSSRASELKRLTMAWSKILLGSTSNWGFSDDTLSDAKPPNQLPSSSLIEYRSVIQGGADELLLGVNEEVSKRIEKNVIGRVAGGPVFGLKALSHQRWRASIRWVRWRMTISFSRHQFPPAIIRHAVWLYLRFTLSYRDVEDLLAERGLDVSYETVRRWVLKFGPLFARELRRRRPRATTHWHLDEMAATICGSAVLALARG
jgi:hypothetical protein